MMNQVIVKNIPDNKLNFFFDLINNLGFKVEKKEEKLSQEDLEFIEGTKEALADVDRHLRGEIELKTIEELLDEL